MMKLLKQFLRFIEILQTHVIIWSAVQNEMDDF